MRNLQLREQEIIRKKEKEAQLKEIRGNEFKIMIEAKVLAKLNARQRDVDTDKMAMQRAIRESEEIKIKEESKKSYAK